MNLLEVYATALDAFNAKNFDTALTLVDELKAVAPLRDMMKTSPLMDTNAYVREMEKTFAQILVDVRPPVV